MSTLKQFIKASKEKAYYIGLSLGIFGLQITWNCLAISAGTYIISMNDLNTCHTIKNDKIILQILSMGMIFLSTIHLLCSSCWVIYYWLQKYIDKYFDINDLNKKILLLFYTFLSYIDLSFVMFGYIKVNNIIYYNQKWEYKLNNNHNGVSIQYSCGDIGDISQLLLQISIPFGTIITLISSITLFNILFPNELNFDNINCLKNVNNNYNNNNTITNNNSNKSKKKKRKKKKRNKNIKNYYCNDDDDDEMVRLKLNSFVS